MTNFLKSKFAKTAFGIVVVLCVVLGATSASAYTFTAPTLRQGVRSEAVMEFQKFLNANGYQVSATGAGSPGMETTYFGSRTVAAAKAWQSANGLVADGLIGPKSMVKLNAGGGTQGGGSSVQLCPNGMTLASNCTLPPAGGTQSGPVTAMLSTDNPASSTLVAGQATADLAHFTFNGTGTVTNVILKRLGVSSNSTPSNVYLFDGATRLTDASSVSSTGIVTFNVPAGIFTVSGSKTIRIKSDIASSSGETVGMMLQSFTTTGGTAVTANLSGNIHSIASATLATISAGTVTPSGATLNPGAGVTLWQSTLTVSTRDVWVKRLALRNVGSAPASAFANFKLYLNGTQVGTATGIDAMGYVTFDLSSSPVLLVSGARVVRVDADVVSGASRTVQLSLRQAADVDFVDSSFGVNISPTSTPWAPSSASTISGASGGTLTIEKDVSSPSTNVVNNGSDVNLGTFKMTAFGESIKVETLRATYTSSDATIGSLRNGRILINGVQYGSTATLNEDSQGTPYTSYTVNYTVMPGSPVMIELHADIYDNDGTDNITAGTDTIAGVIAAGSSNAQRLDSLGTFSAPSSAVSANTLTIASTSMALSKNATYTNQTTTLPATNFKIGAWTLSGSSVEDILLTTLSFDVDEVTVSADDFNESDITNMYVVVKNAGTVVAQPSPLATVSATDNNFSINYTLPKNSNITVELYGNLGSTVTVGEKFRTDLTVTGTSLIGGSSVTATSADTIGQTITSGTASITASLAPGSMVTGIVSDNQSVDTAAFKFAAVTSGFNITDLVFTTGTSANTVVDSVQLYDGATLIATQPGSTSPVTFSGVNWNVPANTERTLTARLVLGTIGISAGTSEATLTTTLTSFTATNTSTGVAAAGTESNPAGNAIYAFAAIPVITEQALSSTTLINASNKPLIKFKMDGSGGTIGWYQLYFDVSMDAATLIASSTTAGISLWDVTSGGNTQVSGTFTNSASLFTAGSTSGTIKFVPTVEQQVATTKTYELRGTVTGANALGDFVTVTLANDSSAIVALDTGDNIISADADAPIVWSDVSASSHATSTSDWTSDFGVKNLPVSSSLNF